MRLTFTSLFVCVCVLANAQKTTIVNSPDSFHKRAIAGKEYYKPFHSEKLWGEDWRKEWTEPVIVPVLNLDSAFGGITPMKEGGGRQTKSLRVKTPDGRVYVLRSVNKTYTDALPEIARGTFVEKIANDQIATNHPYAALTIPSLAEAAKIYHTNPKYYVLPNSLRLGEFSDTFSNMLVLMEERPDETQTSQQSFGGNAEDIVSTEKMVEKITDENDHLMDQNFYLKTRLFDIFVGDWGRHHDNWRWAKFDSGKFKIYRPVPKDRDQTWAKFEGFIVSLGIAAAGLKQLQSFDDDIRNIEWYNYPAIELDRRFTNQLTKQVWVDSAKALQQYLTDAVIENAIRQMPPEIYVLSGKEIIRKLKTRRNDLVRYAEKYYEYLAKNVDIPGTKENELFEVNRVNNNETDVTVYRLNKKEQTREMIYSRKFSNKETDEIRLYGIGGKDIFNLDGTVKNGVLVRVVGGPGKDSLNDFSYVTGMAHKTKYYDDHNNSITGSVETKMHLSEDSAIHRYDYDLVQLDKKGIMPWAGYKTYYGFYVGIGYSSKKYGFRKDPYKTYQHIGVNYSLTESALSLFYESSFKQLLGDWNLNLGAGYDIVRKFSYFGIGNETKLATRDWTYYDLYEKDIYARVGTDRIFANHHKLRLDFTFDDIKVTDRSGGFLTENPHNVDSSVFNWKQYGGVQFEYSYVNINDSVVPSKGIVFAVGVSNTKNLREDKDFTNLTSTLNVYIPLSKAFSLAIKNGAASLYGNPEFYQLNNVGGYYNIRGYRRYRFHGTSAFYNQNELRWLPNVKSYLFNGKAGLVAFFDDGRVWNPGEQSNAWHYGYGGGVVIVPFNKVSATVTYGISKEDKVINIHLGKFF